MSFADASMTSLRVFQEVAERGTLTAAAAALGYTQSAVSRQIASLERAAGVPLMQRRHNGVQLTAAGHSALRRAGGTGDHGLIHEALTRSSSTIPISMSQMTSG